MQGLPVRKVLSAAEFVIEELENSETFLNQIEEMFSSGQEGEDARKALLSLRQGNKPIAEFNIQFNTLLYSVVLSK